MDYAMGYIFEWDPAKAEANLKNMAWILMRLPLYLAIRLLF